MNQFDSLALQRESLGHQDMAIAADRIRNSLNSKSTEQHEIPSALLMLDRDVESISQVLNELQTRLEPCLSSVSPVADKGVGVGMPHPSSDVAKKIHDCSLRLRNMVDGTLLLMERVQL